MNIYVKKDYNELSRAAAEEIKQVVGKKPDCLLGLATGNTPIGIYRELVSMYRRKEIDFSRVRAMNLDEYFGISLNHPGTCNTYLEDHFYRYINIRRDNIFRLNSEAKSGEDEGSRYEEIIGKIGGIDLLILGIGLNGHLGFNEPGTSFESPTHTVNLTDITKQCNYQLFGTVDKMPEYGITMGLKTIMKAGKCILMASGEKKSKIIFKALKEPVTTEIPASILQLHHNVSTYLDCESSKLI